MYNIMIFMSLHAHILHAHIVHVYGRQIIKVEGWHNAVLIQIRFYCFDVFKQYIVRLKILLEINWHLEFQ